MSDWVIDGSADDDHSVVELGAASSGPPEDQLAGVVPVEIVLGCTVDVAVLLTGMRAFSSGVGMVLGVRLRRRPATSELDVWEDVFGDRLAGVPEDLRWQQSRLRWGFTFADGVEVSNLESSPSGLTLRGGGGGGTDQRCDRDYWLSALPPAGPIDVFCEWPRAGLDLTRTTIDGQLDRGRCSSVSCASALAVKPCSNKCAQRQLVPAICRSSMDRKRS